MKGIGPKTACALVTHYGSVSELYAKICPPSSSSSSSSSSPLSSIPSTPALPLTDSSVPVKIPKTRKKSKTVTEIVTATEIEIIVLTDTVIDTEMILNTEANTARAGIVLLSNDDEKLILSELSLSLKNVKASAETTLKRLKSSIYKDVALFKELVTLRDNVYMPELHGYLKNGNHDNNNNINDSDSSDDSNKINVNNTDINQNLLFPEIANKKINNEILLSSKNSKIDTSHFRYFGERDNAERLLLDMSGSFSTPLNLLRQQYSKLERTLGKK